MPPLSLIVAMTPDRVIGRNNKLPWHIPEDLKRFKQITMGHPIIMGRKTYESIGRPLPQRTNIVVTHNSDFKPEGVVVVHSLDEAINYGSKEEEKFVIGGAELFKQALPLAQKIYFTIVEKKFEGDVYFPEINLKDDFRLIEESRSSLVSKQNISCRFFVVEKLRGITPC